jgi:hypothetical protein
MGIELEEVGDGVVGVKTKGGGVGLPPPFSAKALRGQTLCVRVSF